MSSHPFRRLLLAGLFGGAASAASAAQCTVTVDREMPVYRAGETVTFTAAARNEDGTPATGVRAELVVRLDGQKILQKTPVDFDRTNPVEIKFQRGEPGFVIARLEKISGAESARTAPEAGAAFAPEQLVPAAPLPDDFQEFWESGRKAVAAGAVELSELERNDVRTLYRMTVPVLRGEHLYGYLSVPHGKGPFPIFLHIPGSGPGVVDAGNAFDAGKVIQAAVNVHRFPGSRDAAELKRQYLEYNRQLGHAYNYDRWDDRDHFHYRNVILGIDRIITALAERPDYDGRHFALDGSSQGGGLALILAAWNPHVTAAAANVPAYCDRIVRRNHDAPAKNLPDFERIMQTLNYYETANFIRFMPPGVAVLTSCGFLDRSCPPAGVHAAFNRCPARDKTMFNMPAARHEIPQAYTDYKISWLNRQMNLSR